MIFRMPFQSLFNFSSSGGVSQPILKKLNEIYASRHFSLDEDCVRRLNEIEARELKTILYSFFGQILEKDLTGDPIKFLDRLAQLISLKKMQEVVGNDVSSILNQAKGMFREAKFYLQMTQNNRLYNNRLVISIVFNKILSLIDNIIKAFGIGEFFVPPESDLQANFNSEKIMLLLTLFTTITITILPLFGMESGGLIIGGILLCLAVISLVWPYIKPMPFHLPGSAENWTIQVRNGNFEVQGRKETLDEIANVLKVKRHAMLVGPSRIGKSLTAKAFTKAVEENHYPELKGKVVFRINTSNIVGHQASFLGGGNDILNRISATMGRHREEIILVLDEIHMACKNNEKISDQLKNFLDEGGDFTHVIGITTEEEYERHVKDNQAFSLRFDRIDIKSTNRDETLKILSDTVLKSSCKPLIKDGILEYIYERSCEVEEAPQPASALKLLKQCMNRTKKSQKSPLEKSINEVSNKIHSLCSLSAAARGRRNETNQMITQLEGELEKLQVRLSREQKELERLFKSKDLFDRVTAEIYSSSLKISAIGSVTLSAENEKQVKLFLSLYQLFGPFLESYLKEKSEALGVKIFIDEALVDDVLVHAASSNNAI